MKDYKWERVRGTAMPEGQKKRQDRNRNVMESPTFEEACEVVDIKPTKRQASKWNNKKGLAFKGPK